MSNATGSAEQCTLCTHTRKRHGAHDCHASGCWCQGFMSHAEYDARRTPAPAPQAPAAGATPAREETLAEVDPHALRTAENYLRAIESGERYPGSLHPSEARALRLILAALREREAAREDAARWEAKARHADTAFHSAMRDLVETLVKVERLRGELDAARAAAEGRAP